MKRNVFIILILFFSLFMDYTLLPLMSFPFNNLNLIVLSFVFISLYEPKLSIFFAIITGLSKDILGSSRFGIYTLTFLIAAYLMISTSKLMVRDNLWIKLLYTFATAALVSIMPSLWTYCFSEEIPRYIIDIKSIFKKGIINSIFIPFWSRILFKTLE